jgi:hypothetical protein
MISSSIEGLNISHSSSKKDLTGNIRFCNRFIDENNIYGTKAI